jgi:SRSO17 transposase
MDLGDLRGSEGRLAGYVDGLASVIGHADRAAPLRDYCIGLLMPIERKSVEPIAAVTAPGRTGAQHQSLLHFVGQAGWSDEKVLAKVREMVLPEMERHGPIEAWVIDDTGFPKKGRHSVGVARQYCGQLGKQDNCQVAVSLSLANGHASLPVAYRLYLPKDWTEDRARRRKAGVPEDIGFMTKPEIALEHIRSACEVGLPRGVVLMDSGYGHDGKLRSGVSALGLPYVAGILANLLIWEPGKEPDPHRVPPPKRGRRHQPHAISAKELALRLPAEAWHAIVWREGVAEPLASRFARLRVRIASRRAVTASEWLLIEWPEDEREPAKYWVSTLPEDIAFDRLVDLAMMRWRIERDYHDLKQEIGLGHFEGRGWRGFHHHATLCIAAYGFLICERQTIPPSAPRAAAFFAPSRLPEDDTPRGAAPTRATHSQLDRNDAAKNHRRPGQKARAMSLLRTTDTAHQQTKLMTQ